jgi:hypothetical protein
MALPATRPRCHVEAGVEISVLKRAFGARVFARVDEIPLGATGKVDKKVIREQIRREICLPG